MKLMISNFLFLKLDILWKGSKGNSGAFEGVRATQNCTYSHKNLSDKHNSKFY